MPLTPALWRLRQEDQEFKVSLVYTGDFVLQNQGLEMRLSSKVLF
jgi:hypothetical protein